MCVIDIYAMCVLYISVHMCIYVFCMCIVQCTRAYVYVCCMCVYMFMPVVHMCVVHVFACVPRGTLTHVCTCEGQRSTSNVLPYCSALFVFRQGLSLNQSLPFVTIDWPVSPWDLPVSTISIVPSAGR